MNIHDARALALSAVAAHPDRPATMIAHDSPDARIVLFRIEPGQKVAVHTSPSSVVLMVIAGSGFVSDGAAGERPARAGDVITYGPREPHGMRAVDEQFLIAAVIAPRPATR